MEKIKLPQVTLIALSGIGYQTKENIAALHKSCEGIEWGGIKYIQQGDIKDIDSWNKAVVYDLWRYVDTDFAMFVHGDGYVIHPELWNPKWLDYDWCSSPWPLPTDNYSYRTPEGELVRVGNSVGLRSKRLLQAPSLYDFEWKSYYGNTHEDGFLCVHNRKRLEDLGMKFMPFEKSLDFGKEYELPEHNGRDTFCFHQTT